MFSFLNMNTAIFNMRHVFAVACLLTALVSIKPALADTTTSVSPYALQQALSAKDHVELYTPAAHTGFNIDSSYFSGPASGVSMPDNFSAFSSNDQQLYALLIDGRYDFNTEGSSLSSSALHPYVMGGMGVATTGQSGFNAQGGETVPLFRLGGGVAYRLDQQWNLSLDYKTGLATSTAGDQVFTNRGQQSVDLQTLNIGMSYAF